MGTSSIQTQTESDRQNGNLRRVGPREWFLVLVQTVRNLWSVNVLEWASSLAFYGFISAFPLLIGMLIVASYIVDAEWATHQANNLLSTYLPEGEAEIGDILDSAVSERRRVGIISLVIFFFTGRRVLGVLTQGLNHVSDVNKREVPLRRRVATELALFTGLVALGFLALMARPLLNVAWDAARFVPGPDDPAVRVVTAVLRVVPLLTIFVLVYAFVPYGKRLWRAVFVGAAAATGLFLIAEAMFNLLADRIWDNLGLLYGPLALAALLLSWIWYVAAITLICGGFASHIKVMLLEGGSVEDTRQLHVEG